MKNYFYLFIAVVLWSCKEPIGGELGVPSSKIDGIHGSWELISVIQTDEKAPNKRQLDLSSYYSSFILDFDKTELSFFIDSTLQITGNNFFGSSGTWKFYNSQFSEYDLLYPDGIYMIHAAGDTTRFSLGSPIREYDEVLELKLYRQCNEENTLSYEFIFDRK